MIALRQPLANLPPRQREESTLAVLDVTEWYGETSGGIRTYLDAKARYVADRPELRHVVVVPGDQDGVYGSGGVRQYRLRGPRIPRHRPYRFMLATRSLTRIVDHERPDVIEVGSPFLVPWIVRPVSRRLRVPMVCFHHTNVGGLVQRESGSRGAVGRVAHGATLRYLRQLYDMAAVTIVASRSARSELEAARVERIVDIPLGVDTAIFTPARRRQALQTRARWGLPGGPLAGYVGRFASEKSLGTLLDAWASVERRTDARLVLVGAGPEEARLRAHPYASRVIFIPFVSERDELADLIAMLDIVVAPSPLETFGLAALEALACGTPVLTADRGGVAEQVAASGGGRAFASGDAEALAAAAVTLFAEDLDAVGLRGHRYAVREHAWTTVLDRLVQVYRSVAT